MTTKARALDRLHDATHLVPGVPAHTNRPAGHQGATQHGRRTHVPVDGRRSPRGTINVAARQPRVLVAWQRRVAAFFGQKA